MAIWGQSAGAWSANYYGYAYPDDPIVKGLISDSGGSTFFSDGSNGHINFTAVASGLGCGGLETDDELACMQQASASEIQAVWSNNTGVNFQHIADGVTVFSNNTERAVEGLVSKLPTILRINSREGSDLASK